MKSRALGARFGIKDLRFKLESLNPSGSYKDRFAGIAVGQTLDAGKDRMVATSSGNTGAALAAFAAAAGLKCSLYVSENAPQGKLEQMLAYGSNVYRVAGFTIDAAESKRVGEILAAEAEAHGLVLNTTAYAKCPVAMEGIKTIAYELAEACQTISDVFVPVGGAGLYVAISRGFDDLATESGQPMPRMHVVQPEGNDTVATPLRQGAEKARSVTTSTSISGLGVANVLDGDIAIDFARKSGGSGQVLDEDHIREVQSWLAKEEGILVEPAGAVSVAGAIAAAKEGLLETAGTVVCILTGHGFKDPATLRAMGQNPGAQLIRGDDIPATF